MTVRSEPLRKRALGRLSTVSLTARFVILGVWALLLVTLAALWAFGPLEALWRPTLFAGIDSGLAERPWIVAAMLTTIIVGLQIAVPQGLLVAVTTLVLGFWLGLATALAGTLAGAVITYFLGRWLARRPLRQYAGVRFKRVSRLLARRGVLNMAVINLLPIGPYTIVNLAAGTSHLRFRDFFLGTALGIIPTTLVIALVTHLVARLARAPTAIETALAVAVAAAGIAVLALLARWGWHWMGRQAD